MKKIVTDYYLTHLNYNDNPDAVRAAITSKTDANIDGYVFLEGTIDTSGEGDYSHIRTSPIRRIGHDEDGSVFVITRSGSQYYLGEPSDVELFMQDDPEEILRTIEQGRMIEQLFLMY